MQGIIFQNSSAFQIPVHAGMKKGYGFMNFKCLYVINGISGFRDRFVSTQSYIFIISKIISILPNVNFCKWCGLLSARFCPR